MKKFKFKNWIIFFTTLLLISTIMLTINGRKRMSVFEDTINLFFSPIQSVLSGVSTVVSDITYPIKNIFILSRENTELKDKNDKLQQEVIRLTLQKNEYRDLKKLKGALKYTSDNKIKNFVTADVVSRDPSNWYTIFVINVGIKSGVIKDSMVITSKGLVGQVYEASDNFAKVITLSDVKGSVSFRILDEKRNYDGIVDSNIEGGFTGYFFDTNADVRIGDKLVTSGLGVFPKGVMVGEVTSVLDSKDSILKNIELKSYVDFKNINKVLVIPPNKSIDEMNEK